MTNAQVIAIPDLSAYLKARSGLLAAREGLFSAVRAYLRPEQRPDAARLGDRLAESKARGISEADWVANAARGYLTVLESPNAGRPFRLRVLQQGNELRVGVRLAGEGSLAGTFPNPFTTPPRVTEMAGQVTLDWHFDATRLYESAQNFEDAVFKIGAVFEAALQLLATE